jgi:hypothetical protein
MAEQEKTPARVGKVVQQATVLFAGAEITAVLAEDGYIYGALPHLCRALDLDGDGQRARIEEQPALAKGLWQFPLAQGRQLITTWCLRSDLVPYWLAVVSTRRMKPEKRSRIDFYQDQVGDVLGRLFGATPVPSTEVMLSSQNPVFAEGLAVARMALDQAEHISDLVKQTAIAMANKLGGGNFFGAVFGQLYRTFNVTSYKLLTQAQYPKAVEWLQKQIKIYQEPST